MPKQSSFLNMVLCLFSVCLVCSAVLGVVYAITKEPIDAAQLAKINNAIAEVVPAFDNNPSQEFFEVDTDGKKTMVYPAKKGTEIVGYAVQTSTSKGFSGSIILMVGFKTDGTIYNTKVISHSETPGLGAKMTLPDFSDQFKMKNPAQFRLSVKKDGGDVDAITASTISSRAYCDALENGYKVFKKIGE
jgi:Na+-translocating ferredoxin:NAD+ oxidoreductase subunit G